MAILPLSPPPWPPRPRSAGERVAERARMVEVQIAHPRDGRPPVVAPRVVEAMAAVPRHAFLPPADQEAAYRDEPLPIGFGQTISQPYIVAVMTELAALGPGEKVLEVGTGSGYQAAVLAHLTPHVRTMEIVPALAARASAVLVREGYGTVRVHRGDGRAGWPEEAPFDAILCAAAPEELPDALWAQLAPGGRLIAPVGPQGWGQRLLLCTLGPDGRHLERRVMDVRFVPMVGAEEVSLFWPGVLKPVRAPELVAALTRALGRPPPDLSRLIAAGLLPPATSPLPTGN